MVSVALAIVTILLLPPSAHALSGDPDAVAAAFVSDINQVRAAYGLAPYEVSKELTWLAASWSANQAAAGDVFHNLRMFDSVSGANWSRLNENVGLGDSEDGIEAAFVASPDHLANYLNLNYTHVGVGVVVGDGGIYVTEDFGQAAPAPRLPAAATPTVHGAPVPTPVSPPAATHSPTTANSPVTRLVAAAPVLIPARVVLVLDELRTLDRLTR
jgi:hypothetical protein